MIKFHGGCAGCTRQEIDGLDTCMKCQYFDADWGKPDLNNKQPATACETKEFWRKEGVHHRHLAMKLERVSGIVAEWEIALSRTSFRNRLSSVLINKLISRIKREIT